MTRLEFLLQRKQWCNEKLAMRAEDMPGTMTHDRVGAILVETIEELDRDFLVLDHQVNRMVYLDFITHKTYSPA